MINSLRIFTFLFVAFISISPVFSATWDGGGVNDLASNPVNWTGNVLPPYGNTIYFDAPSPQNCTWDLNETYAGLTIGGGFTGSVTLNSTLTLANPGYTVTYNGNDNTGGSVPNDYTYYQQGQTVIVLGNADNLVKSGYTFAGWNTAANGLGTDYAASGAVTFTMGAANVTLYAKWTANLTCTVDSDCASGYYCSGTSCFAKKNNGSTCSTTNQCQSENCVDGYCCNSSCADQCQSCNISGYFGICSTVTSGQPHGTRTPCAGSGTCQGTCTGSSPTACTFPFNGTTCSDGNACTFNDVCNGAGTCAGTPSVDCIVSAQIQTARDTSDGSGLSLSIDGALITYLKPAIGTDAAGFFLQAEQPGPALFIAVDPATLAPSPVAGDRVNLVISDLATNASIKQATAISGYTRTSQGNSLSGLAQDLTAASDLVTNLNNYESELITLSSAIITSSFVSSGTNFVSANIDTTGVTSNASLVLRIPSTLRTALGLSRGCIISLSGTPLWRYNLVAEPSAWVLSDIAVNSCPICGNGIVEVGEICDDHNVFACGTCSSDCSIITSSAATGTITVGAYSSMNDGDTFTIHDGINPPVTFEVNKAGGVSGSNVAVNITSGDSASQVAVKTAAMINIQGSNLLVTAGTSGSTITLTHDRNTALGNQPIDKSGTSFTVSATMSGGLGGDCLTGVGCSVDADCASNICISNVCQ